MLPSQPRAPIEPASDRVPSDTPHATELESLALDAPQKLVEKYLELSRARRVLDEQLAFLRSELELVAATALTESAPRGRFVAPSGVVAARLMPTCSFDRATVARELQRGGKLADVATLTGPQLSRFLAREPVWASRLAPIVRHRHNIMLMTGA